MNKGLLTPFRVGLVSLGGIAAMFVLLTLIGHKNYGERNTNMYTADFKDATGLSEKSRVQIAGIEVGIVSDITLTPGALAHITLRLRKDVKLYADAKITKRAVSLLGDYLLDIYPGSADKQQLPPGSAIPKVINTPGMNDVFEALGDVTKDIQGVAESVKNLLDAEGEGSIKSVIRSMNTVAQGLNRTIDMAGGRLDYILQDAQRLAATVRTLASSESGNISSIIGNIRVFTEQANRVLASINSILGTGQGQLRESVAGVKDTLAQLQKTLTHATNAIDAAKGTVDDVHDIVKRVDQGEGTLGKLIRDDGIAVKLDHTLGDVNSILAPISELQLKMQIRDEIHWRPGLPMSANGPTGKAALQVVLQPRPDKFYGFELVSDPRGTVHNATTINTDAVSGLSTGPQNTYTITDDLKFSAYLGKRFGPLALRVGLIESTGGVGSDLYLWNDRLRITVDAFDFADVVAPYPRIRVNANLTLFSHLFLGIGGDDLLNPELTAAQIKNYGGNVPYGRDGYIQGGIQFTDDDLKGLITLTGIPRP